METHSKEGKRERYFADDDRCDLKEMVRREKMRTTEDHNAMLARLSSKVTRNNIDTVQWQTYIYVICRLGGFENAARARRPGSAFSSPRSQFFAIRTDPKASNDFVFIKLLTYSRHTSRLANAVDCDELRVKCCSAVCC